MAVKEREIQNQIFEYLELKEVYCWENKTQGTYDPRRKVFRYSNSPFFKRGVADILGILPCGTFFAIEVKRPGAYPSKVQKEFLTEINRRNGIAFVARSVDDVKANLIETLNL